jgi:outer membrane protein OmpA-like peptidoglycan-associated protein
VSASIVSICPFLYHHLSIPFNTGTSMKNISLTYKMIKNPLLIAILAAVAVGCSSDDAVTDSGRVDEPMSLTDSTDPPLRSQAPANEYQHNAGSSTKTSGSTWTGSADQSDSVYRRDDAEVYQSNTGNSIDSASPQNPSERLKQDWSLYREYNFNSNSNVISRADSVNAAEIADYIDQNPESQVGIDGAHKAHVETVRDALISVGIPEESIIVGEFDEDILRGNGRVAVVISN